MSQDELSRKGQDILQIVGKAKEFTEELLKENERLRFKIASLEASPWALPYAGAKAALNALTSGFAAAFSPNVRVNCIVVGPFGTDVSDHWADPRDKSNPGYTAGGMRIGRPDEIAGAALYLASEASSFTNGALLRIDGGPVRARRERV